MPRTPDRFPGEREEEGILLEPSAVVPTTNGEFRYVTGVGFRFYEEGVETGLSGSGITANQHLDLDQLVHDIAETSYLEVTRSGGQVTDVIIYTDSGKTTKIREVNITRTLGQVSQVVTKQYDGGGSLVQTLTQTITRSGGQVASIDAVLS